LGYSFAIHLVKTLGYKHGITGYPGLKPWATNKRTPDGVQRSSGA